VAVLIASDRISNTFCRRLARPRRPCDIRVPAHKCQEIRTRSEEIIVFALGIDCHDHHPPPPHHLSVPSHSSVFSCEKGNHLDVARSSQQSNLVCMRRRDSPPPRAIDKPEEAPPLRGGGGRGETKSVARFTENFTVIYAHVLVLFTETIRKPACRFSLLT